MAFPCRMGKRLASSRMLIPLPKIAVMRSNGTSVSPNLIWSPIHNVTLLTRIQLSFRLTNVPLLEPASLIETRPSSASSMCACNRDSLASSRTMSHDGSRPHVLISGFLLTGVIILRQVTQFDLTNAGSHFGLRSIRQSTEQYNASS